MTNAVNINTTYQFGGNHFFGNICMISKEPVISFTHLRINNVDQLFSLVNSVEIDEPMLTEMRDELNELITFMDSLDPSSSKQPGENEIELDVKKCQRCGKDHKVRFRPLKNPIDNFTKWGICVNTGQPVLLGTEPSEDEEKAKDYVETVKHFGGICDAKVITTSETGPETIVPLNQTQPERPQCGLCHRNTSQGILRDLNAKAYAYACFNCAAPYMHQISPYKFEPFNKSNEKDDNE